MTHRSGYESLWSFPLELFLQWFHTDPSDRTSIEETISIHNFVTFKDMEDIENMCTATRWTDALPTDTVAEWISSLSIECECDQSAYYSPSHYSALVSAVKSLLQRFWCSAAVNEDKDDLLSSLRVPNLSPFLLPGITDDIMEDIQIRCFLSSMIATACGRVRHVAFHVRTSVTYAAIPECKSRDDASHLALEQWLQFCNRHALSVVPSSGFGLH